MLSRGSKHRVPCPGSELWDLGTGNQGQGRGHQWLVTWQKLLGSVAILSLVSLTAPGGKGLPGFPLFCNSCWTRLEGNSRS